MLDTVISSAPNSHAEAWLIASHMSSCAGLGKHRELFDELCADSGADSEQYCLYAEGQSWKQSRSTERTSSESLGTTFPQHLFGVEFPGIIHLADPNAQD